VDKKKTKTSKKKSNLTMEDLLSQYKKKTIAYNVGDRIEAKVVGIDSKSVFLDIGGKTQGVVVGDAFIDARSFIKHLKVGDKVKGRILITETPEGYSVVSLRNASKDYFWNKLEEKRRKNESITVIAKSTNSSGIVVDVFGLIGFIPLTHVGYKLIKKLANIIGNSIKVKILDLDRRSNRIILSEKFVSEEEKIDEQKRAMAKMREGEILSGEVSTVSNFGIFIKIDVKLGKKDIPVEGLVHISEMSWEKVDSPSNLYKVGDKVKVVVIGKDEGRLSLSIKQMKHDPWESIDEKYKKDMKVEGKVIKQSDFGVFVELELGIEGLIHITKIPPGKKLKKGDSVNVYIEDIDKKAKKISLGLVLTQKPVGYK